MQWILYYGGREWRTVKRASYITSKEAECSGFYAAVKGVEGGRKSIPILLLKRWNTVDSIVR